MCILPAMHRLPSPLSRGENGPLSPRRFARAPTRVAVARNRLGALLLTGTLGGCGAGTTTPATGPNPTSSIGDEVEAASSATADPPPTGSPAAPRGSAALGDGRYRILLDRHDQEGEERRIEAHGREVAESTFLEGKRKVQHGVEVTAVRFAGRCTTRRVNAAGRAAALSCQVTALQDEAEGRDLVERGVQLVVERAPKRADARVTVDGRPVSEPLRNAVDLVLGLSESNDSEDEVFGSTRPRSVGDRWPLAGDELAQRLEQQLHAKVVQAPTGEVELVGVEELESIPVLHLRARVGVTQLTSAQGSSRFTTTLERKLPIDLAGRVVWQSTVGEYQIQQAVPERPGVTLEFKLLRTMEQTNLPVE